MKNTTKILLLFITFLTTNALFSQSKKDIETIYASAQLYADDLLIDSNVNLRELQMKNNLKVKLNSQKYADSLVHIIGYEAIMTANNGVRKIIANGNRLNELRYFLMRFLDSSTHFILVVKFNLDNGKKKHKDLQINSAVISINSKTNPKKVSKVQPYLPFKERPILYLDSVNRHADSSISKLKKLKVFIVKSPENETTLYQLKSVTVILIGQNGPKKASIIGPSTEKLQELLLMASPGEFLLFTDIYVQSPLGKVFLENMSFTLKP